MPQINYSVSEPLWKFKVSISPRYMGLEYGMKDLIQTKIKLLVPEWEMGAGQVKMAAVLFTD